MSSSAVVCHLSVLRRPLDSRPAAPCAPVRSTAAQRWASSSPTSCGHDGEELVAHPLCGTGHCGRISCRCTEHQLVQVRAARVQAVNTQAVSSTKSGLPADVAAKVIAKAVTARKPRTRYTVGRDAALITAWRDSCPTGHLITSLRPRCVATFPWADQKRLTGRLRQQRDIDRPATWRFGGGPRKLRGPSS